jgi:uncharacterized protein
MSQSLHADTIEQQSLLAKFCRDGVEPSLEGVTDGRLHNYRRLVFGVVREALSSTYPLTVNLLTNKEWSVLIQEFFETHNCQDPQVWKMPLELIEFTEKHQSSLTKKYPLLIELLNFEWKEVEYYMMPDEQFPEERTSDFFSDPWIFNPESEILTLSYPLHLKNARFISISDEGQYFCLIFRQPETFKVKFLNLSPFFAWLIATMQTEPISVAELSPVIAREFGITDVQQLKQNIEPFYKKLCLDGMILSS